MLGCWAQHHCGLCVKNPHLVEAGVEVAEKYWAKTKKATLQTKLKLYPVHPKILYNDLLKLATKQKGDDIHWIAFCAHWTLFEHCRTHGALSKGCEELFSEGQEWIVTQLARTPEIQGLLAVGREFYGQGPLDVPRFALHDQYCTLYPLEKENRERKCAMYQNGALHWLKDPKIRRKIGGAYRVQYQQLLEVCFDPKLSKDLNMSYCLVTTFLRIAGVSEGDRELFLEIAQDFLAQRHLLHKTPFTSTEDRSKPANTGKKVRDGLDSTARDYQFVQKRFKQQDGVISWSILESALKEETVWRSQRRFTQLLKAIGVKSFYAKIGREEDAAPHRPETYFVHPMAFHQVKIPCQICAAKHDYILTVIKTYLKGAIVRNAGLWTPKDVNNARKRLISDLVVEYPGLTTYVEYTGGGRKYLKAVIQKAISMPKYNYVGLVDWKNQPKPPYQEQRGYGMRYKGRSNLQDAQELWFDQNEPSNIEFFSLGQLGAFVAWCRSRKRVYHHRAR